MAGRIAQVLVCEGQTVEAGAVLLRLEDKQYHLEVALAKAEIGLAQAKLERLIDGAHKQERAEADALHQAKVADPGEMEKLLAEVESLSDERAERQLFDLPPITATAAARREPRARSPNWADARSSYRRTWARARKWTRCSRGWTPSLGG